MNRPNIAAGPIAFIVLLLAGCASSSTDDNGWQEPQLPDPLPHVTAATVMPFEQFQLSREERVTLQQGTAELLQGCMSDYGLTVEFAGDYIEQVSEDPTVPIEHQWGGLLGTMTEKQAAEYGYAAPPGDLWVNGNGIYLSQPSNITPIMPADTTAAAKISGALYGPSQALLFSEGSQSPLPIEQMPRDAQGNLPSEGGCHQIVEERIGVPFVDLLNVQADAWSLALDDGRVVDRNKSWVGCMQEAGYSYKRMDDSASENGGAITAETVRAATADVKCTERSDWPDVFYAVLADYQEQAIKKNSEKFESALRAEQKRLAVVRRLTDGQG